MPFFKEIGEPTGPSGPRFTFNTKRGLRAKETKTCRSTIYDRLPPSFAPVFYLYFPMKLGKLGIVFLRSKVCR